MCRLLLFVVASVIATLGCVRADIVQHRGIWLHPDQYNTKQLADEWIEKISAAHINLIYPLVWHRGGTAWFKSKISPMAKDVPEGFDPLGHLINISHARGIAVHAWFVNGSYGDAPSRGLFVEHPDWKLQEGRGGEVWYDLGKPEVRRFQRDLMIECLRNYDIDGLHFDYIRYGGQTVCYCSHCQSEFSQKYGFRALRQTEECFPAFMEVGANSLTDPTTARVLASFDDGKPAIAINTCGKGEAVLLNWHAAQTPSLAVESFVRQIFSRFQSTSKNTFQLNTSQTAAKYRAEEQTKAAAWLRSQDVSPKLIDERQLDKVPASGTLVLYGQYHVSAETGKWLEEFVLNGGHCLFVDGPVFGIKNESLQRVLGFKSKSRYFHRATVVSPAPSQDMLKAGPPVDIEKEKQRMTKWVEYRTWTVSELVRDVYRQAKSIKPKVWINAAVFYKKEAADRVCQDWYGWLKEGCIDYVLPMAYTEDNAVLAQAFREWKEADPGMERIIPGLSIYSRKSGKPALRDLALVSSQLDMCKSNETHGSVLFCLRFLTDKLGKLLANGAYSGEAQQYYPGKR